MKPKERIIKEISTTVTFECFPDPPDDLRSAFKTLEDWLTEICTNEKPTKPVGRLEFELTYWEQLDEHGYYLNFVGQNDYQTATGIKRKIEFKPANMFFRLANVDYEKLDYKQVVLKLIGRVKDFTKTEIFKNFYSAHPGSLYFNGIDISP